MTFAERLKALRERAGLSQYALAQRTGLSKQTLSSLEQGDREPSWGTVQVLALALGVLHGELRDDEVALPTPPERRPRGRPRKQPPAEEG